MPVFALSPDMRLDSERPKKADWEKLIASFEEKIESLEKSNHLQAQFISHLSHELRNPLTSMMGVLEFVQNYKNNENQLSLMPYLDRIHHSAELLIEILNEAVDFSKIEAGKMTLHREWTDMKGLIHSAKEIALGYLPKMKKEHLQIELAALYNLPKLKIDGTKIKQVLINLLTNAIKFTNEGSIKIISWIENNELHIEVEDTGIGIKEEDRDKIFNPFEQITSGKGTPYGAGLGMTISKSLVEMHGGRLTFESEFGKGSTFCVYLPLLTT